MPGLTASAFVEYLPRTHGRIRAPRTAVRRAPPLVLNLEKGRKPRDRASGPPPEAMEEDERDTKVVEVPPRLAGAIHRSIHGLGR